MQTILLVDYDPLQAFLRKSVLDRCFNDVCRVSDAAEALCLVEQTRFANDLALVITGHLMPGIGGPEFVAELTARMPHLPVLVLGAPQETADDYPGAYVCFRPRSIDSRELMALAVQLAMKHQRTAA
jgi:CheY-like chemotaxis protein